MLALTERTDLVADSTDCASCHRHQPRLTTSRSRHTCISVRDQVTKRADGGAYRCRVFFLDLPLLNDVRERVWDLLPFTRYIVPCDQDMEAEILAEELKGAWNTATSRPCPATERTANKHH